MYPISSIIAGSKSPAADPQQPDADDKNCPVCMEQPVEVAVFSCVECANWVCGECMEEIATCPSCRVDIKAQPMTRNVALERMLRK